MSKEDPAVCRFLPWLRYGTTASLGWSSVVLGKNGLGGTNPPVR